MKRRTEELTGSADRAAEATVAASARSRAGRNSLLLALAALAASAALVVYLVQLVSKPPAREAPGSEAGSGTGLRGRVATWEEPRAIPQLAFTDEAGRALDLGDFRGRVLLLNIWATWCPPCRKEMPSLDRLQGRLGGPHFEVVAVSIDQGSEAGFIVREFYRELGIAHLRIYLDPSGGAARTLGAPGLPVTLLVDRGGREVGRRLGPAEWDSPEAVALVQKQLAAGASQRDRSGAPATPPPEIRTAKGAER